jgi:hypothetical protein
VGDNIKMDLVEIGFDGVDWTSLAQDRENWRALVNTVMNLRVPYNIGKVSNVFTTDGLSRNTQLHTVS